MKKFNKIVSMLLAVLMILGAISAMFTVQVFADDSSSDSDNSSDSNNSTDTETEKKEVDYINDIFATPDEKLATMTKLSLNNDKYELYYDEKSGEVACVNKITGDKLFTNPYDVAASMGSETTKYEILSQVIVRFKDNRGQEKIFTSYEQAVLRDQVNVAPIKGGLRVEYTIGREQAKTLVPRLISKERFDEMILAPLEEAFGDELYSERPTNPEIHKIQGILTSYTLISKDKLSEEEYNKKYNILGGITDGIGESDKQLALYRDKYPIIDTMAFYICESPISDAKLARCEQMILTYCPEYTYEELDYDHALTDYESEDENPPVFRLALEYRLDDKGLTVRLPANGIRFNESLYTLDEIEVLPYMGAGNSGYSGYNFFPDGSGTLFDFEQLNTLQTRSISNNIYGTDFAYHEIKGTYQRAIRYPVFGIVENTTYHTYTDIDVETGAELSKFTISGAMVEAMNAYAAGEAGKAYKGKEGTLYNKYIEKLKGKETIDTVKRGFVAIIEEGDALASLATYHAGSLSDYNTIKMSFIPRPKDTYNLQDSISVGTNADWTVVSDRKYVGSYKIRYIMLHDTEAEGPKEEKSYDTSWLGMAVAYRDYLTENNVISKFNADNVENDIPLYIETFGAVETTEKYLSIPVTVMAPLTSFEQIIQMYNELSADDVDANGNVITPGIKNINFKLTGYANGGMKYSVPGNLKFEKAVGGNKGFQELLDKAAEINSSSEEGSIGIYPDFDLVFQLEDKMFDGYTKRDHAAKTIDDRYATRREYSATQQKYMNYFELIVSPAYFNVLYERLTKNYADKYENVMGISVSTLGQWLNSDFDEDEPYNREDSKGFTVEAFDYLDKTYGDVMTSAGNAYVWKYADHILNVNLDSSRYNFAANAVPFIGVVLHGSISFAGEPLNMEGDIDYAILKAIENGASPYFILSMANTQALKEDPTLSKYYSIRYDIWKDDIASVYNVLNDVLKDVQDKYIVDHEFINGERVPDSGELEADIYKEYIADLEAEQNAVEILANELAFKASQARKDGRIAEEYAAAALLNALSLYTNNMNNQKSAVVFGEGYYENVRKAYKNYYTAKVAGNSADTLKNQYILLAVTDYNVAPETFEEIYNAIESRIEALANTLAASRATALKSYLPGVITNILAANNVVCTESEIVALTNYVVDNFTGKTASDLEKCINAYVASVNGLDAKLTKDVVKAMAKEVVAYLKSEGTIAAISTVYVGLNGGVTELLKVADKNYTAFNDYARVLANYNNLGLAAKKQAIETAKATYNTTVSQSVAADYETAKQAYTVAVNNTATAANNVALASKKVANAKTEADKAKAQQEYNAAIDAYFALIRANTVAVAKAEYDSAAEAYFAVGNVAYKNALVKAIEDYEASFSAADKSKVSKGETAFEAYIQLETLMADYYYQLENIVPMLEASANDNFRYLAASIAQAQVLASGFQVALDDCLDIYFEYQKANTYYKGFQKLVLAGTVPSDLADLIYGGFDAYVNADVAKATFEAYVKEINSAKVKGRVDIYAAALAEISVLREFGYDSETADENMKKTYDTAVKNLEGYRKNAITNLSRLDGNNLKALIAVMDTTQKHLDKANDAVVVLESGNFSDRIVNQAKDRARAVAEYLNGDANFIAITEGRLSEYELEVDGKSIPLYYVRNANNAIRYFYGTRETGYTYLVMNEDGTFSIAERGLNDKAQPTGYKWNGLDVYLEGTTYFVATLEGTDTVKPGYTYLTYNKYYNSYEVKANTVYNGTLMDTLADGTEVFYDKTANVYYSANADGTYTRYNYYMSINEYYTQAIEASATSLQAAYDMIAECGGLDATFEEDVKARIQRENDLNAEAPKADEEEVESKYYTENIVTVTYGNDDNTPYKTFILNYNNYTVKVVVDEIEYTIGAYEFVEIKHANK